MSQINNTPNLVCIQGNLAVRYVDGKQDQIAEIDWSIPKHLIRKSIEEFRKNGIPKEGE